MHKKAAVIFGVGPREGVGAELCCRAARDGFHVFVNGRSPAKLSAIVASIIAEGGSAEPLVADVTAESQIITAMRQVASSSYPLMLKQQNIAQRQTLLFTGASASLRGKAGFYAFAAGKGALRMLTQSIAREFGPQGIHVAHVLIDGVVEGEKVRTRFPEYINGLGEDGALKLEEIADAYMALHAQGRSAWTQELDLRPYKESF